MSRKKDYWDNATPAKIWQLASEITLKENQRREEMLAQVIQPSSPLALLPTDPARQRMEMVLRVQQEARLQEQQRRKAAQETQRAAQRARLAKEREQKESEAKRLAAQQQRALEEIERRQKSAQLLAQQQALIEQQKLVAKQRAEQLLSEERAKQRQLKQEEEKARETALSEKVTSQTYCPKLLTNPSNAAGTSCFADSVLTALLVPSNPVITEAFLNKTPDQLLICDVGVNDNGIRQNLIQALRDYDQLLHSDPTTKSAVQSTVCLDVRRLIASCRNQFSDVGPKKGGKYDVGDPTEFWAGLTSIFQFEPMLLTTQNINYSDGRPDGEAQTQTTSLLSWVPPNQPPFRPGLDTSYSQVLDTGVTFNTRQKIEEANFIAVSIPHYTYDAKNPTRKLWKADLYSIPDIMMSEDKTQAYALQSGVCWAEPKMYTNKPITNAGHYVSIIKCGETWYKFDDLKGPVPEKYQFDDPKDRPFLIEDNSVLLFYRRIK